MSRIIYLLITGALCLVHATAALSATKLPLGGSARSASFYENGEENIPPYTKDLVQKIRNSSKYQGIIGKLLIRNDYDNGSVKVALFHADAAGKTPFTDTDAIKFAFLQQTISASADYQTLGDSSEPLIVGSDWGIQILFENGVKSAVKPVAAVMREARNAVIYIDASAIYDKKTWKIP